MTDSEPSRPATAEDDPFQGRTEVKRLLRRAGVRPSARLGQSFLVDRHAMERLVDSAQLTEEDLVLEVGTGTGGLTAFLLARAGRVISVELDRRLVRTVQASLARYEHLVLLACDVLANKHQLNPLVTEALLTAWAQGKFKQFKLVSNFPYSVATPALVELIDFQPMPERMCFTVQREVADRLLAEPASKDYGWLSVIVQSLSRIERLHNLSASCFYPKPRVDTTIVRVFPRRERPAPERLDHFRTLVQYLFQHRRKMLSGSLRRFAKLSGGNWSVRHVLGRTDIDGSLRPERLDVASLWALSDTILEGSGCGKTR